MRTRSRKGIRPRRVHLFVSDGKPPGHERALHKTGRQTQLNAALVQDYCTEPEARMTSTARARGNRSFRQLSESPDRLHVTLVSARIRTLDGELGRQLFIRNRNGAQLTPAAREFERFAQSFVQIWERARHQLAIQSGRTSVVTLGGELRLWNPPLLDWLVWMKKARPEIAIQAQFGVCRTSSSSSLGRSGHCSMRRSCCPVLG